MLAAPSPLHRADEELAALRKRFAHLDAAALRHLAFEVVALLLMLFRLPGLRPSFLDRRAMVQALLVEARCTSEDGMPAVAKQAWLLSSRLAACGAGWAWPIDDRVPYEVATALRRACDAEPALMLPHIVRDAYWLLARCGVDPTPLNDLLARHGGAPC